jgi:hypothetical protein
MLVTVFAICGSSGESVLFVSWGENNSFLERSFQQGPEGKEASEKVG